MKLEGTEFQIRVWNELKKIPKGETRTYKEIDDLRAKFEKAGQPEKLVILDEINAYVEELEKIYSSA